VPGECTQARQATLCASALCTYDSVKKAYRCTLCEKNSDCGAGRSCQLSTGTCVLGACAQDSDCPPPVNPCTAAKCFDTGGQMLCGETAKAAGTPCNDNNACTTGDVCDGSGMCGGSAVVCDDGTSCTTDACNQGICNYVDNGTCCKVSGIYYSAGTYSPESRCYVCQPEQLTSNFVPVSVPTTCSCSSASGFCKACVKDNGQCQDCNATTAMCPLGYRCCAISGQGTKCRKECCTSSDCATGLLCGFDYNSFVNVWGCFKKIK
jgi:hypothetical protein